MVNHFDHLTFTVELDSVDDLIHWDTLVTTKKLEDIWINFDTRSLEFQVSFADLLPYL